ncbi:MULTISPECIES: LysR substrate-binding domain-containing protein [unclassified Modicisalibacter]|uniref:LysR substrate-binding domain-containing protein n=1 Tax=unclassified Modicisalibacter TaxID=2679913 RepID=UPI001CCE22B6|nr:MULTISPECIES: LysR substrate-binding domain-containing protein [unclassified Modicisalibacter]MBZ9558495.1 LysR family transcriptional regulator [Modicisalibacter sp. R2A 31.J]MBZ9575613.1 LysR family transcriptional regulator [Modicisalibacter sp. MOD 31.J]
MTNRTTRLPPLNALRVFWVVMRHGSFRGAADELLISPQAVSQQIRLLEDILGVPLFERRSRVIEPTEQAGILAPFVQAGFDELSEGVNRITRSTYRHRININVSPHFAMRYLMERLDRFCEKVPGADIRLTTMVKLPDFAVDDVDISIQWGFGQWKEYDVKLLIKDPKIIGCEPEFAKKITKPEDLTQLPLLHPVLARDLWARVLAYLNVGEHDPGNEIQFQDAATMRRAAISGLGVGLISKVDAMDDLKVGRLVAPFGADVLADMPEADIPGFYVVVPRSHKRVNIVNSFWDWITAENWDAYGDDLPAEMGD